MMMKFCFTSTETVGLLGTGAQDVHLDFHTASELSCYCETFAVFYCFVPALAFDLFKDKTL